MLRVGLTGGIASGKSTLGRLLAQHGAAVRDADEVVAELYAPDRAGARAVAALFGPRVLATDGSVDRAALGRVVLGDAGARGRLESAIHPLVRAATAAWMDGLLRSERPPEVAVFEAALLVETGSHQFYDRLVVVSAPLDVRRKRALAAGMAPEAVDQLLAAQTTDEAREKTADYVVRNERGSGSLGEAAKRLWKILCEDAQVLADDGTLNRRKMTF